MTFSMYFLFPEKGEDHDQGLTSWELTRVEETEENVTRISYINDDGELTYAADISVSCLRDLYFLRNLNVS